MEPAKSESLLSDKVVHTARQIDPTIEAITINAIVNPEQNGGNSSSFHILWLQAWNLMRMAFLSRWQDGKVALNQAAKDLNIKGRFDKPGIFCGW